MNRVATELRPTWVNVQCSIGVETFKYAVLSFHKEFDHNTHAVTNPRKRLQFWVIVGSFGNGHMQILIETCFLEMESGFGLFPTGMFRITTKPSGMCLWLDCLHCNCLRTLLGFPSWKRPCQGFGPLASVSAKISVLTYLLHYCYVRRPACLLLFQLEAMCKKWEPLLQPGLQVWSYRDLFHVCVHRGFCRHKAKVEGEP